MNIVLEAMKLVTQQIESTKKMVAEYFKDTSVPLEERWAVFEITPNCFKETGDWITRLKSLPEDHIGYDGPFFTDRYSEVDMLAVVNNIEENYEEDDYYSAIDLNAVKEEILQMNLGSFTYDW